MGRITNEFTCVEFQIDQDYEKEFELGVYEVRTKYDSIKELIDECEFKQHFNLSMGCNNNMYFTAAPSGSKAGWVTSADHAKEVEKVVNLIQEIAGFSIVNKTVTSDG